MQPVIQADAIVYEFSRPKVERGDFSAFLNQFNFDRLPTGRRLRGMMNSMVFCIHGWDDDPLRAMVLCCLRSFTALSEDGNPNVKIEYDPLELLAFLKQDLAHMNAICDRAGMFEQYIQARTNSVIEFFGLPTDGTIQR